ncbi:MAG: Ig-like domain-containing protein [Bacteroidetes bacterium]|nr:Ig-like domain-containing protein [Bacteroidota bacterium]
MYWFRVLLSLFLISLLLSSCNKNQNVAPIVTTRFTLTDTKIDGKKSGTFSNVDITPSITLSFSEPLDESSVSSTSMSFSDGTPIKATFSNHDSTVIVQPATPLKYLTSYTLAVNSTLKSKAGHFLSIGGVAISFKTQMDLTIKFPIISDSSLLDIVQQQTLKYFYDFAEPVSGMARERNTSGNLVTTGGSGFGLMALIVGINRGFISRANGIASFNKIVSYLEKADRFHGAWPHWIDGTTGKTIPFSNNDNGADLVETSFMLQGLLTVRQYLTSSDTVGNNLINRINNLWQTVEFDWFRQNNQQVLYWHWSPDKGWIMNMPISGYDEALIVYILAAGSPTHSIPASVYQQGWAQNGAIKNGKTFYGHVLPLGQDYGGPLFFAHYSFLGFDPHTQDAYADYWIQNTNQALINHDYCSANPKNFTAYADSCWGLTASDNPWGYNAQSPTNDNGTITPTAAIASMPYTPAQSMKAIRFFYYILGDKLWGAYGFYDAFNLNQNWTATSTLAIDQGPIVVMLENYRTGLLWKLFMSAPEVQAAKTKLGFTK